MLTACVRHTEDGKSPFPPHCSISSQIRKKKQPLRLSVEDYGAVHALREVDWDNKRLLLWCMCVCGGGSSLERERRESERVKMLGEERGRSRDRMCTVRRDLTCTLMNNNKAHSYIKILVTQVMRLVTTFNITLQSKGTMFAIQLLDQTNIPMQLALIINTHGSLQVGKN